MRLQNPFSAINSSNLEAQVLYVLTRAEARFSAQEIHRLLPEGGSNQGTRNALQRLVQHGIVLSEPIGNQTVYIFNRQHLLADALLNIAQAKRNFLSALHGMISAWQVQPLTVQLFGSAARNEMAADSDIDIFLGWPDDADENEIDARSAELTHQASLWTGNDVRLLQYAASEVAPSAIFTEIMRDGLNVAGDPNWLRRHLRKYKSNGNAA